MEPSVVVHTLSRPYPQLPNTQHHSWRCHLPRLCSGARSNARSLTEHSERHRLHAQGWRAWYASNAHGLKDPTQAFVEASMEAMADRSRLVGGPARTRCHFVLPLKRSSAVCRTLGGRRANVAGRPGLHARLGRRALPGVQAERRDQLQVRLRRRERLVQPWAVESSSRYGVII